MTFGQLAINHRANHRPKVVCRFFYFSDDIVVWTNLDVDRPLVRKEAPKIHYLVAGYRQNMLHLNIGRVRNGTSSRYMLIC